MAVNHALKIKTTLLSAKELIEEDKKGKKNKSKSRAGKEYLHTYPRDLRILSLQLEKLEQ